MAQNSVTTLAQLRSAITRSKNLSSEVAAAAADAIDELNDLKADSSDLSSLEDRVEALETTINNLIDGDNVAY